MKQLDLEVMKKLIKKYETGHADFLAKSDIAERYYRNETDILFTKKKEEDEAGNPMRNADNRIPRNFHGLIVNQKASYAFTAPPTFDTGNDTANRVIVDTLGDKYAKNCKDLCVNAANSSVAWVHYWIGEKGFRWAVVDSKEIIPVWSKSLEKELIGVLRVYMDIEEETGDMYIYYEYWTETEVQAFKRKTADVTWNTFIYNDMFIDPDTAEMTSQYAHGCGEVPFIPFFNNNIHTDDLKNIKRLIDVYDKVFSGFINDLDDIQELIFVLVGYGGESLNGFLQELKKYKTIKIEGSVDIRNLEPNTKIPPIVVEINGVLWDKIDINNNFNNDFKTFNFKYNYYAPFVVNLKNKNVKLYFWNTSKSNIEVNNVNVSILTN